MEKMLGNFLWWLHVFLNLRHWFVHLVYGSVSGILWCAANGTRPCSLSHLRDSRTRQQTHKNSSQHAGRRNTTVITRGREEEGIQESADWLLRGSHARFPEKSELWLWDCFNFPPLEHGPWWEKGTWGPVLAFPQLALWSWTRQLIYWGLYPICKIRSWAQT